MNKNDLYKNSGIDIDEDLFKDVPKSAEDTVKEFLQQPVASVSQSHDANTVKREAGTNSSDTVQDSDIADGHDSDHFRSGCL